mmetsp:Transcript_168181/g.540295  ORF Transcript_168181/g.540295 Transcript_168181/m.540295 type:complete len:255 (-) Transcript_168181:1230-1994(-)
MAQLQVQGRVLVEAGGADEAADAGELPLLWASEGLSFWGGVDPATGVVIDRRHPLHGQSLAGRALAIPSGRGSCTGSSVLLQLILNGHAPAAILLRETDEILALGAIIADELFDRSPPPVLCLGPAGFDALLPAAACTPAGPCSQEPRPRTSTAPSQCRLRCRFWRGRRRPRPPHRRSPFASHLRTRRCLMVSMDGLPRWPCESSCAWQTCRGPPSSSACPRRTSTAASTPAPRAWSWRKSSWPWVAACGCPRR